MAGYLAYRLASRDMDEAAWHSVFVETYADDAALLDTAREDLHAVFDRDPGMPRISSVFFEL